jgi:hypothetical protein
MTICPHCGQKANLTTADRLLCDLVACYGCGRISVVEKQEEVMPSDTGTNKTAAIIFD